MPSPFCLRRTCHLDLSQTRGQGVQLPRLLNASSAPVAMLVIVLAAPVLGYVKLGQNNDALAVALPAALLSGAGRLHVLQLDVVHDTLLALGEGHVGQGVGPRALAALAALRPSHAVAVRAIAAAATDAPEALWCLVLLLGTG